MTMRAFSSTCWMLMPDSPGCRPILPIRCLSRQGAACFLALIGTRVSEEILIQAALGPVKNGGHEAACALSFLQSESAKAAALEWLRRNDGFEEADGKDVDLNGRIVRTWSAEEMMRSTLRENIRWWFERKCSEFAPLLELWSSRLTQR